MKYNEIIKALECCTKLGCSDNETKECPLKPYEDCSRRLAINALDLINRQKAEVEKLQAFKSYFDELYGKGLEVANWHLNGNTEPFDNFYESALEEMEEGENG